MPYGLFDYIPDSTIHTMGAASAMPAPVRQNPYTDAMISSEAPPTMVTRAIPENPPQQRPINTQSIPEDAPMPISRPVTKMAVGENSSGIRPPMTLAAICGEDPQFCKPVTKAIPEDPTQVLPKPPTTGSCPPGYGTSGGGNPPTMVDSSTNAGWHLPPGVEMIGFTGKPFDLMAPGATWIPTKR